MHEAPLLVPVQKACTKAQRYRPLFAQGHPSIPEALAKGKVKYQAWFGQSLECLGSLKRVTGIVREGGVI